VEAMQFAFPEVTVLAQKHFCNSSMDANTDTANCLGSKKDIPLSLIYILIGTSRIAQKSLDSELTNALLLDWDGLLTYGCHSSNHDIFTVFLATEGQSESFISRLIT
jgi:hypothetical protein